jgi:hypothetical protein
MRAQLWVGFLAILGSACGGGGAAPASADRTVPLPVVAGLSVSATTDALTVSWSTAGDGLSYVVLRTDGGVHVLGITQQTSWKLTGLSAGEIACVAVKVRVGGADGTASAPVCAQAPQMDPAPPAGETPFPGPAWVPGVQLPVTPAAAFVAGGRLWVVGTAFRGNVGLRQTVSAALDDAGLPRTWEIASAAPTNSNTYAGWAGVDLLQFFAVGGTCCGAGVLPRPGFVHAAALHPDGSTSDWTRADAAPDLNLSGAGALSDSRHLYTLGGTWWSGGSFTGYGTGVPFVYVADLDQGTISGWRRSAPLPRQAGSVAATFNQGVLYALLPGEPAAPASVAYARPAADGSIPEWRMTSAVAGLVRIASAGGRLYGLDEEGTLLIASPGSNGDVTSWSQDSSGPLAERPALLIGSESHLYWLSGPTVLVATPDKATGRVGKEPSPAPGLPAAVRASTPASGSVRLTWDAVPGAESYEVRLDGGDTARTSSLEWTATGLDPLVPAQFAVRAANSAGAGPWTPATSIVPWPSSTWRPGIDLGGFREYAFLAGNTLFAVAYPSPFAAPLDGTGLPWGSIGRVRYVGNQAPHHSNEAGAVFPVPDGAACLVLSGGRDYQQDPGTSAVSTWCMRDDGFEGEPISPGPAEPMPSGRFDHASAALGRGVYVLGGSQQDANGATAALSDVSFATFGADLSVRGWTRTTPLPGAAATLAATAAQGRLYAVAPSFAPDRVLVAQAATDGSLGAWKEAGRMPFARSAPSAIVVGGYLYVLGGGGEGEPTALIGKLDASGSVASWSADRADSFVGQRQNPAVLSRGDRLYVFGSWGFQSGTTALQFTDIDPATGRFKPWR